jgi:methyl-accepting chemotaxis protein
MPSAKHKSHLRAASRAAAVLTVAALALGASACGGDDEVPAAQQWAGDLCSAVDTWRDAISSATASVTSNPSREGLESAADDVTSATETLVDDLRDLGAPDTEAGEQARAAADELADSAESSRETIENAVDEVSGTSGLLEAVSTVSATISQMSSQLLQTLDDLRSLGDADDELREAFQDAPACDGLTQGGS